MLFVWGLTLPYLLGRECLYCDISDTHFKDECVRKINELRVRDLVTKNSKRDIWESGRIALNVVLWTEEEGSNGLESDQCLREMGVAAQAFYSWKRRHCERWPAAECGTDTGD